MIERQDGVGGRGRIRPADRGVTANPFGNRVKGDETAMTAFDNA
ncbi:hypothetical protein ACFHW2_30860 [Actinomadura sp. LOL_016]